MSDLVDALTTAITGRPPINPESELVDILGELVHAAGSAAAAARLVGKPPTTFYRWRNFAEGRDRGVKQRPSISKQAMVSACRRAQLPKDRERKIRRSEIKLAIRVKAKVSKDEILQTIHPGRGGQHGPFPREVIDEIIDLWLAGEDALCDEAIREAIDTYYVAGMEIVSTIKAFFEGDDETL